MNNEQVDIIIIVCCIIGFIIGLAISSYGTFIYNVIFYVFVITGVYFCISMLINKKN